MGCINSKSSSDSKSSSGLQDVGFDWWPLVQLRKWEEVEKLVDEVSSTCDQLNNNSESLLHTLASSNEVPRRLFKKVVEKSFSQYHRRQSGMVPLHQAIKVFDREHIVDLLQHDKVAASMSLFGKYQSALDFAIESHADWFNIYPEVFGMLLDAVATGSQRESDETVNNQISKEEHILNVFRLLCKRSHDSEKLIDLMIRRDKSLVVKPGCFVPALSTAKIENLHEVFHSFFSVEPSVVTLVDDSDNSLVPVPLHAVLFYLGWKGPRDRENLLKVVTAMVDASPETVRSARSLPFGLHALHFAVAGGVKDVRVFSKLLEAFPQAGNTPSKVCNIAPWMYLHSNFKSTISSEYHEWLDASSVDEKFEDYEVQQTVSLVVDASMDVIKWELDTHAETYAIAQTQMPMALKFLRNPFRGDIVALGVELMTSKTAFRVMESLASSVPEQILAYTVPSDHYHEKKCYGSNVAHLLLYYSHLPKLNEDSAIAAIGALKAIHAAAPQLFSQKNSVDGGDLPLHSFIRQCTDGRPQWKPDTRFSDMVSLVLDLDPSAAQTTCACNDTTLHLLSAVRACTVAQKIDKSLFSRVLNSYPEACLHKDDHDCLPLHRAVNCRDLEPDADIVEILCHAQAKAAQYKRLPLHFALDHEAGHISLGVIQPIVEAYPQGCGEADGKNLAIHVAISRRCDLDVIKCICLAHKKALSHEVDGAVPLVHAAMQPHPANVPLMKFLLEVDPKQSERANDRFSDKYLLNHAIHCDWKSDLIIELARAAPAVCSKKISSSQYPLHLTLNRLQSTTAEIVKTILDAYPAAATHSDGNKESPLHLILHEKDKTRMFDIAKLIIEKGGTGACKLKDKDGNLPLHLAIELPNISEETTLLIADAYPDGCQVKDKDGNLPLHSAVEAKTFSTNVIEHIAGLYPEGCKVRDHDGNLPLHSAIERGDAMPVHVIEKLFEMYPEGATVRDKEKNTPLHSAVETLHMNKLKVVQILLRAGSKACELSDAEGNKPLHSAIESKSFSKEAVQLIMEAYPKALEYRDKEGNLPIHSAVENSTADPPIDVETITEMIKLYPDGCTVKDRDGNVPLVSTVECVHEIDRRYGIVKAMVDMCPKSCRMKDKEGNLALHSACESRNICLNSIKALVAAYPEGCGYKDKDSNLPLHSALNRGDLMPVEAIEVILAAYPNATTYKCDTSEIPLFIALHRRGESRVEKVKLLLKADPSTAEYYDYSRQTYLLHLAAKENDVPVMKALVEASPKTAGFKNESSMLPLHAYLANHQDDNSIDIVSTLLNACPDAAVARDSNYYTPLHTLLLRDGGWWGVNKRPLVEILLKQDSGACKLKDKDGNLPLHLAIELPNVSEETTLLIADAYPDGCQVKDKDGNLPLHSAVEAKTFSTNVIEHIAGLYPEGCKVRDHDGNLPLHSAIERGDAMPVHVIEKLFEMYPEGATVRDKEKNTPLHSAVETLHVNKLKVVQILLRAGSKACELSDREGNLCIHSVCESSSLDNAAIMAIAECYPEGLMKKDRDGQLPIASLLGGPSKDKIDVTIINDFLRLAPESTKALTKSGLTALHIAVDAYINTHRIDLAVVQSLIKADPDSVKVGYRDGSFGGRPCIHHVCDLARSHTDTCCADMVKELAKYHSDPIEQPYRTEETVVHWSLNQDLPLLQDALIRSRVEIAKHVDSRGMTLIHHTMKGSILHSREKLDLMTFLIDAYPTCASVQDRTGSLPLHYAVATRQDPRIVKFLINAHTEGVSTKDNKGDIALHIAARDLNVIAGTVDALCEYAKTAQIKDRDDRLPLRLAFEVGQGDQIKDLIKAAWPDASEFMFGRDRG